MSCVGRDYLKYAVLLIATAFITLPVFATTYTVTNLNDSGAGSLRAAITSGSDTIVFQPGLTGTITLSTGSAGCGLTINNSLTISGPGASILAVSGNNNAAVGSVFCINNGPVFISGLTIENGYNMTGTGGGIDNKFGTTLTVTNSTISGNTAPNGGGGIYSEGTLTVTNSTISGNHANSSFGGGIDQDASNPVTVINSTISGNTAFHGGGIGIQSTGKVTVTNSTISGNTATFGGGINNPAGGGGTASLKSTNRGLLSKTRSGQHELQLGRV